MTLLVQVLFLLQRRCVMGIKSLFGFGQARDKPTNKSADAG